MTTAAYLRVSTTSQNEAGQRREIRKWISGNGLGRVQWFLDIETGDHLNRPGFDKLQAAVFAGEIDTIVAAIILPVYYRMARGDGNARRGSDKDHYLFHRGEVPPEISGICPAEWGTDFSAMRKSALNARRNESVKRQVTCRTGLQAL